MACSKLEAMAIYLVKQACGNDKLACVYITHAFMQGDYANAPTETEALTSFLDDYKDAMENRKAGGRSFR